MYSNFSTPSLTVLLPRSILHSNSLLNSPSIFPSVSAVEV